MCSHLFEQSVRSLAILQKGEIDDGVSHAELRLRGFAAEGARGRPIAGRSATLARGYGSGSLAEPEHFLSRRQARLDVLMFGSPSLAGKRGFLEVG
jgi:hypothetical protein